LGRRQECEVLDGLLADVRAGRSRALVGYAAETAPDFQVARADGVESGMELAFAALHQLTGPMLDRLGTLPGPRRAGARSAAFRQEEPPGRKTVAALEGHISSLDRHGSLLVVVVSWA
jgi:hypothetical protein